MAGHARAAVHDLDSLADRTLAEGHHLCRSAVDAVARAGGEVVALQAVRQREYHLAAIVLEGLETGGERRVFAGAVGTCAQVLGVPAAGKIIGFPVVSAARQVVAFHQPVMVGDPGSPLQERGACDPIRANVCRGIDADIPLQFVDVLGQRQKEMIVFGA